MTALQMYCVLKDAELGQTDDYSLRGGHGTSRMEILGAEGELGETGKGDCHQH